MDNDPKGKKGGSDKPRDDALKHPPIGMGTGPQTNATPQGSAPQSSK